MLSSSSHIPNELQAPSNFIVTAARCLLAKYILNLLLWVRKIS